MTCSMKCIVTLIYHWFGLHHLTDYIKLFMIAGAPANILVICEEVAMYAVIDCLCALVTLQT